MSELERVSITIEPELLRSFDALLERAGIGNRSEGIRDLIRTRLADEGSGDPDSPAVGSLTLVYDHHRRELSDRLTALGHDHHALVQASMHVHLDADRCLEVISLQGTVGDLRRFGLALQGLKGVDLARLVLAPAAEPSERGQGHGHGHG